MSGQRFFQEQCDNLVFQMYLEKLYYCVYLHYITLHKYITIPKYNYLHTITYIQLHTYITYIYIIILPSIVCITYPS